jgi:anti-anti-sigma factor
LQAVADVLEKETSMHPSPRERLRIVGAQSRGGEHRVRLEGELDIATVAPLRESLRALDADSVMLDLSGVTFTDSTGLAMLLDERVRASRHGTSLRVHGATGQTRDLLERTGVLALLESAQRRRAT